MRKILIALSLVLISGFSSLSMAETVKVGDVMREYEIHVPQSYDGRASVPLVFGFHGGGGTAERFKDYSDFTRKADEEGFIVIFPQGTKINRLGGGTWNGGGGNYVPAERDKVDDIGFVKAMLADIKSKYKIDTKRIYATGMSNGGMISYDLACNMSDVFAAVAPISTTMTARSCTPENPVAVLHIHGTDDNRVPVEGGKPESKILSQDWPPVFDGIHAWEKNNQCSVDKKLVFLKDDTECWTKSCAAGTSVSYCMVEGMGHTWPGAEQRRWQKWAKQNPTDTFKAADMIWSFFKAHPKQ